MTPEPLWRRKLRRPAWERHETHVSDFDPMAPIFAAANRLKLIHDRQRRRIGEALDRMERRER